MCLLVKQTNKKHLQKLVKHYYEERRTNTLVKFKALLWTDPTNPDEITTAILKFIVQILFSL